MWGKLVQISKAVMASRHNLVRLLEGGVPHNLLQDSCVEIDILRVMANAKIGGKIPTVLGFNSKANAPTPKSWGWRIF